MEKRRNYNRMPAYTIEGKLRVKELLKEKGLSLQDLATRIKGNREVISRALTGNPTYSVLANIAAALEVNVQDLFIPTEQPQQSIQGVIAVNGETYIINSIEDFKKVEELIIS